MKQEAIRYFQSRTSNIEFVFSTNCELSFPEHNHISTYTIGLITDGSIKLKRKNRILKCEKDYYFIIPPYEPHAIIADGEKYTMISICIKKDFVLEYDLESALPILLDLADSLIIKNIISREHLQIISDAVDMLFLSIISEYDGDESIQKAQRILEQMPQEEINLDELCQSVFMSKYHFIRKFKRNIGLTPHHFQFQNRIRQAQHLLTQDDNLNITEVAYPAQQ